MERPALLALGTAVPDHRIDQANLGHWMAKALADQPKLGRWLEHLYTKSGIDTRYSCLPDAEYPSLTSRYAPNHPLADAPTTSERMAIYEQAASTIGVEAARRALDDYAGMDGRDGAEIAAAVTHLIVVSCTGFFAPGLDQVIARRLGLRPTVERTLIGFMGCAATFNALRLAAHIVAADAGAQVLIVCVELCSLHVQPGNDRTNLIVASLFADGAAACLVGAATQAHGDHFVVEAFHTSLQPDSTTDMVWHVGDYGFSLELSALIPRRLEQAAPEALRSLVDDPSTLQFWAIHPGGRAIVDRLAAAFELSDEQAEPSRAVLREYGNMSSPTVLFVLQAWRERLRAQHTGDAPDGVMMAFGPGLVTEMAHMVYLPGAPSVAWPARRQGAALEALA
jgi:predicted naringenin-chalcone synthase